MAENNDKVGNYDYSEEALKAVIRIRGMVAEGLGTNDISKLTGKAASTISNIKSGVRWINPKIPIAFLKPRLPNPNEKCVKCLREPRVITKDDTCLECACIELSKLNFLFINESKKLDKKES